MKLLKSIVIPAFCLFAAGALPLSARAVDAEKIQEATVLIITENGRGSGSIINESGNILTNEHVVNGAKQIFALRNAGGLTRLYKCKCEASQQDKDVCLAVLTSSIKSGYLTLSSVDPKPTEEAFQSGFSGYEEIPADRKVQDAFDDAIAKHKDDPRLEGDGVDITGEMFGTQPLQGMVAPSISAGRVKRMGFQALNFEARGTAPAVKIIEVDIPVRHGSGGGPIVDAAGFLMGVMATRKWAVSEMGIEKFLGERKVAFHKRGY